MSDDWLRIICECSDDFDHETNERIKACRRAKPKPKDCFGPDGRTPLMIALTYGCKCVVEDLLIAGANINAISAEGESVLYMALHFTHIEYKSVEVILLRAKVEARTTGALVEKLLEAECCFPYVTLTGDADALKEFLKLGYDVNSRSHEDRTAIHYAALSNQIDCAKFLLDNGADVNALEPCRVGALFHAAEGLNPVMIELLLDNGANTDPDECIYMDDYPLMMAFRAGLQNDVSDNKRVRECVELLLQHGAYPHKPSEFLDELYQYPNAHKSSAFNSLVAHIVVMDMLVIKKCDKEELFGMLPEIKEYYTKCRQVLKLPVVGMMSLLDLLGCSERKMKLRVRGSETFAIQVQQFYHSKPELQKSHTYYINTLKTGIAKAQRALELEDRAIQIICGLFHCGYNEFFLFAKEVVGYLSIHDIEQLCQL